MSQGEGEGEGEGQGRQDARLEEEIRGEESGSAVAGRHSRLVLTGPPPNQFQLPSSALVSAAKLNLPASASAMQKRSVASEAHIGLRSAHSTRFLVYAVEDQKGPRVVFSS